MEQIGKLEGGDDDDDDNHGHDVGDHDNLDHDKVFRQCIKDPLTDNHFYQYASATHCLIRVSDEYLLKEGFNSP